MRRLFQHRMTTPFPRRGSAAGFTMLELLVVMVIVAVVATVGFLGFEQTIVRTRLVGDAAGISNALQRARAMAVRHSSIVVVEAVTGPGVHDHLMFYFDEDDDQVRDPGEDEVFAPLVLTLARRPEASVYLWSATTDQPDEVAAMVGLEPRAGDSSVVVIEPDGKVRQIGSIRIGMGPWPRSVPAINDYGRNFMEVKIATQATGRTVLRKFIPGGAVPPYQQKMKTANGSPNWKFYTGR